MARRSVTLARSAEQVEERRAALVSRNQGQDGAKAGIQLTGQIAPLTPTRVATLQRQVGNHAVGSLLVAHRGPVVQRVDDEPDLESTAIVPGAPSTSSPIAASMGSAPSSSGASVLPGTVMAGPEPVLAPPRPPSAVEHDAGALPVLPDAAVAGPVAARPPVPSRTGRGYLEQRTRARDAARPDAGVATGDNSLANDERIGSTGGVAGEVAKPIIAGTGAVVGYGVGHGLSNASSALSGSTNAGGLASGAFGGLSVLDQGLGVYRGLRRYQRDKGKDAAGAKLGLRKAKAQSLGVAAGIAGVTATAYKLRSSLGTMGTHAAGVAGGAAGVVGGGLLLGQGIHRTYQAYKKYKAASATEMYSDRGRAWQDFVKTKQKRKGAAGAARAVGGALGVAAGGLLLAGMAPAAFAVGIAAMAVGGVMALWKMGSKVKTAWKARKAANEHAAAHPAETAAASQPGTHDKAKQLGDKLQRAHSAGGEMAGQIRDAYRAGKDLIAQAQTAAKTRDGRWVTPAGEAVPVAALEAYDAMRLMATINVSPTMLDSQSGQELIQKKLSLSEAL